MEAYPVMLNLHGKKALIVGGGKIAYRKAIGLLKAGAEITMISPDIYSEFHILLEKGQIRWKQKEFEESDLRDALIVIAATNKKSINREIAQLASDHQLINVVDDSRISNFHVPAKITRGKLTIAVGTEGASPILAKKIRDELAGVYDESYRDYLHFLEDARKLVYSKEKNTLMRTQLLTEIAERDYQNAGNQRKFFERMMSNNEGKEV